MKIVLTGATGFVGSCILQHLIADPRITTVSCLTRRPFSPTSPKVDQIIHEDFSSYEPLLLERLAEHRACIWALGGKESDLGKPDVLTRVTHTFTLAMANGIAERAKSRFTFCYLSGMGADQTENAWFPWEKLTRHLKGRTEKDLLALAARNQNFGAHCFRPGGILPDNANRFMRFLLAPIVVSVGELADSMITEALDDQFFGQHPVIHNSEIKLIAKR